MAQKLPFLVALSVWAAIFVVHTSTSFGTPNRAISSAVTTPDCHAVKFVGVRGSGDNSSTLGVIATAISEALAKRAASARVDYGFYGLPYTAVGIQFKATMPVEYWLSERQGRNTLRAYVREQVRDCRSEDMVVEGYSQGAQVVGDVFSKGVGGLSASELSHIKAVVLIADPRFNSQEGYDAGTFSKGRNGILGARTPGDLNSVAGRIRAWCRKDDLVCQGPGTTGNHAQSKYLADDESAIATFFASKLRFTRTSAGSTSSALPTPHWRRPTASEQRALNALVPKLLPLVPKFLTTTNCHRGKDDAISLTDQRYVAIDLACEGIHRIFVRRATVTSLHFVLWHWGSGGITGQCPAGRLGQIETDLKFACSPRPLVCGQVDAVKVTITSGSANCAEALGIVHTYYHLPASAYQGSGGFAQVKEWMCGGTSGDDFARTGHAGDCERPGQSISIDKP